MEVSNLKVGDRIIVNSTGTVWTIERPHEIPGRELYVIRSDGQQGLIYPDQIDEGKLARIDVFYNEARRAAGLC